MRRFPVLLACALAVAAVGPSAAWAEPRILRAEISDHPLAGQPLGVHVEARDARHAINGVEVRVPGRPGRFGISACRVGRNGRVMPTPALGAGKRVSFDLPYVPTETGVQDLEVEVTSGACGETRSRARRKVSVKVGLADVPPLPTPDLPGNGRDEVLETPKAKGAQAGCADVDTVPVRGRIGAVRAAVMCLINQQRAVRRLDPLRGRAALRKAATRHSRDMVRRSYFDHEGPAGPSLVDRLKQVGYWPASASENLGEGAATLATPKSMVIAWMMSPGHRENILDKRFVHVGVGIVVGLQGESTPGAMYTAKFGRRY